MGEIAEALGEQLGRYFWEGTGWFILPLAIFACVHWVVKRVLTPLPEPDVRTTLVAILGALLVARCGELAFIRYLTGGLIEIPDELYLMMVLDISFLGAMLLWMVVKVGRWPIVLLLGYAIVQLVASIWLLFRPDIDPVGRAAVLGFTMLFLGLLLWSIVALKSWNKPQLEEIKQEG